MTIYFFVILILNLWVWKITSINIFISIFLLLTTILAYKNIDNLRKHKFIILLFLFVLFAQYRNTTTLPLTKLTEDETVVQIRRMREYENPRIAHIIEERPESIIFFKLQKNLSQLVDPNFYFFANHPRERAAITEFEKFPYVLLPFFIIGLYRLIRDKKYFFIILFLMLPLCVTAIIGMNNTYGPFSLFPFFLITTYTGIIKKPIVLVIYLLVFLQTLAYAIY